MKSVVSIPDGGDVIVGEMMNMPFSIAQGSARDAAWLVVPNKTMEHASAFDTDYSASALDRQ